MKKLIKNNIFLTILTIIPIITLLIGFAYNEDFSTGGASWDFNLTWPIIVDYSNFNFTLADDQFTMAHMPLHYALLSFLYSIFNDQNIVRIIYLILSLLLPFFLYLNLTKIYNQDKFILIIFSISFLFFPFFRASAIWANSHLTATIFFLIGNYFYLKSKEENVFAYKIFNLLFLSFAIYSIQSYLILFLYYLYNYFSSEKFNNFIKLFIFSAILALPGLFFISLNPRLGSVKSYITQDLLATILTNFSIIFFFLSFILINKENISIILDKIKVLKKIEIIGILFLIVFVFYIQQFLHFDPRLKGGGFFNKLSYLVLNNNFIFVVSSILGLITTYIITKQDPKFLYVITIMNLMSLNYLTYQKYFEPLFLIIVAILFKNFLINNILSSFKNTLLFYGIIFLYFVVGYINFSNEWTYRLLSQ